MSNDPSPSKVAPSDRSGGEYVVVARRYRPQTFDELVGQQQVCRALAGAIATNRVGHAYLFTGARGVGKTSAARIFAKALNCHSGPTIKPCNDCDICQAVSTGDDIDVLEIDGASNRGIDEIRQLRSNVNIRPSRSRFKIYIIDEVHMLTPQAFNALLKTLEEPPEHVKFVFCTTDPEKIPITVLSRCQRYDFPPIQSDSILERLQQIAESEGVMAQPEALQMLARRAAGSMRDSQSLLEQLISFCGETITADDVHRMLGTTSGGQLATLTRHLIDRDTAAAIAELDAAVSQGVDVAQLALQLLGYFRDIMVASSGGPPDLMLNTPPGDMPQLLEAGQKFGIETVLAIVQILDQTVVRMRQCIHGRTLVEMALVRICKLEDLDQLTTLIGQLRQGQLPRAATASPTARAVLPPSTGPPPSTTPSAQRAESVGAPAPQVPQTIELTPQSVDDCWRESLAELGGMTAETAGRCERVAISAPNRLVVSFKAEYNWEKETCERPDRKERLEQALARKVGRSIRIDFELLPADATVEKPPPPRVSKRQMMREMEKHPLVHQTLELFDGEITDLSAAPARSAGSHHSPDGGGHSPDGGR